MGKEGRRGGENEKDEGMKNDEVKRKRRYRVVPRKRREREM